MFTLQSRQIENALRTVGLPDISAREMMSGMANCQSVVEHRAPVNLARPVVNYFPTIRPAGPTISPRFVSESNNTIINIPPWQNVPFTPIPYLPLPPWQSIPYPGWPGTSYSDNSLTVAGPVQTGPLASPQVNVTNLSSRTVHVHSPSDRRVEPGPPGDVGSAGGGGSSGSRGRVGPPGADGRDGAPGAVGSGQGGIINEGDTHNYGDVVNENNVFVRNDLTVQNNVTNNGPVTNNNTVINNGDTINNVVHNQYTVNHGPTEHHSETHFDGPNFINGPNVINGPTFVRNSIYIDGTPLQAFNLELVSNVSWDGTVLEQTKKTLRIFGKVLSETTGTVLDCGA